MNSKKRNRVDHDPEYLSELFFYNNHTGTVLSRVYRGLGKGRGQRQVWPGKRANTSDGPYQRVNFDKVSLQVGRLAWLLVVGDLDRDTNIKHRNGDPGDNRFINLYLDGGL